MLSFPSHHRAATRGVGHFVKMTLPQNTNSSPRSLCDFAVKIFLGALGDLAVQILLGVVCGVVWELLLVERW